MRPRLSYANVIATLALFIALGGSSYAALRPPRNSVGAAQIRTGAVHSSDVADGSLQPRDLSSAARQTLGGGGGKVFFAHVGAGGKADRGNSTFAALEAPATTRSGSRRRPASARGRPRLGRSTTPSLRPGGSPSTRTATTSACRPTTPPATPRASRSM